MPHLTSTLAVVSLLTAVLVDGATPARAASLNSDSPSSAERGGADDGSDDAPVARAPQRGKPTDECRASDVGLRIAVDRKTVNLDEGRLVVSMDGPICSLTMRIHRKDGTNVDKSFRYQEPEQELRWTPIPRDEIEKLEIRITAKNDAYQAVWLIPWSVSIEHKEVRFDTNKAVIRDSEVPSLKDSLAKIQEVLATVEGKGFGPVTLFIAGHTDTRGTAEHNMTLSRSRAESIAGWFQKQGLCIPIAFEGFGETALRKLTADEVDEPANRRVDYILAVEPPVIKKGAIPAWKLASKGC